MKKIIFASGNKGKTKEVKDIFSDTDFEIVSLHDLDDVPDIIEDGNTFEENAKIKAQVIFEKFQTPVIADDSGLCVDQIDGEPGVFSARYAGENCTYDDNNNKLLKVLSTHSEPHKARFICGAVYLDPGNYVYCEGVLPGKIINEKRGEKGFGYDPIFLPDGHDKTLAEMDLAEKNKISHRAKAFNELKVKLKQSIK